ncbi:putative folate metabolism gamma-glutamate ligase [bacterium (Candidatus Gribaldobacteria) CG08_land_8_20_14_0_20_39_15]|uniref:Putative folate metabolism gamma-glutamate ligase n=1 Tax=bacterium (Candidatus Gribaldobacteria) CG08_land_8_20_14_0_20_39_15 TaxID=2014273 RepID=A0A2M6XU27_9BACT|nr:MAG: putative folate metabolism gamma-glutamate ligase [bacterium (Candidatus Gribaldobacteria) CG08_land_8_20_14_0_20_39_15]
MKVIAIKTRTIKPPQDDIYSVIDDFCPKLKEKDIFVITSKVLAIHQGQCIPIAKIKNKDDLIKKEADLFIPRKECPGEHAILAIKKHTLVPSAGVDESNANGHYILWPKEPEKLAKTICQYLKKKFSLKRLAVVITDSHCIPLRYGTMGISIGFYGLKPLKDYRGKKDIFGRVLRITQANVADALAVIGVLAMGEGNEKRPMAIIRGADFVEFTNKETYKDLLIPLKEDIFYPLLKNFYR